MKERSPVKKNILKLIPFIEIIAGIIFLCLEIHDYRTLYSMAEADAMYGDLLIFVSTKRMYLSGIFLDNCYTDRNQLLEK